MRSVELGPDAGIGNKNEVELAGQLRSYGQSRNGLGHRHRSERAKRQKYSAIHQPPPLASRSILFGRGIGHK
jgi:hypothetical protein